MTRRIRTTVIRKGWATVVQYREGRPPRAGDLIVPAGSDRRLILWHRAT